MNDIYLEGTEGEAAPAEHPVTLRRVPLPLAGSFRYQWRLSAVLVSLAACRGGAASIEQLHTLVWALRDEESAVQLRDVWNQTATSSARRLRGYVPGLTQTLLVAQAEGLIEQNATGRQTITVAGRELIEKFREHEGSLGPQEAILLELAPFAAASMWRRLGGGNA